MRDVQINLSPSSVAQVSANLRRKTQTVRESAGAEMGLVANELFAKAQQKVPVVTGALASSGRTSMSSTDTVLRHTIGYGNAVSNPLTGIATADYAVDRHESYNPEKPESYKWLENTMIDNSDEFLQRVANAISAGLSI